MAGNITLFKHDGITVRAENPFAEDCLDRKEPAELLGNLISTVRQPFVLSINGRWGMGKTTFVRMLKALLEQSGHQCLYFNAWESDFAEDPFIALLGSIDAEIEAGRIEISGSPAALRTWQKTKAVGGSILRHVTPLAVKIATHGILDLEVVQPALGDLKDAEGEIASELATYAKERIGAFEAEQKAIGAFRHTLAGFSRAVSEVEGNRGPVVMFIDELDRCRPSFAVQLLERIKHLFSVDGLLFALSVDREQLAHSVRGLYGPGMDANGYLRRFIDLEYQLPDPSRDKFVRMLFDKLRIWEGLQGVRESQLQTEQLRETLLLSSELFGLTLRDLEQCAAALNVVLRVAASRYDPVTNLLAFLVALRAADGGLYDGFMRGNTSAAALIARLKELPRADAFFESTKAAVVEGYLYVATPSDVEYRKALADCHNEAQLRNQSHYHDVMYRVVEDLSQRDARDWLRKYALERLELAKQFV